MRAAASSERQRLVGTQVCAGASRIGITTVTATVERMSALKPTVALAPSH
jgi:hypothetical protein